MGLTVPISGELLLLAYALKAQGITSPAAGVILRLYSNDYTPNDTTETSDLVECTLGGYTAVHLTMWSMSVVSGAGTATHSEMTFSFADPGNVYGCYVCGDVDAPGTTSNLLWIERFSGAPLAVDNTVDIKVTPKISAE